MKSDVVIVGGGPAGIEISVGEVASFDTYAHTVHICNGDVLSYEKLALATGTEMVRPPIKGVDLSGVCTISKSLSVLPP